MLGCARARKPKSILATFSRSEEAMERDDASDLTWGLAPEFRGLWESCASPPDVFQFLGSREGAGSSERLDVLRVDQHYRWQRGEPLPLQAYLRRFPDIAARTDLVRLLVEGDQCGRRESGAAAHHLWGDNEETDPPELLTQVISIPRDEHETITEERVDREPSPSPQPEMRKLGAVGSTLDAALRTARGDRLDFDLDTSFEARCEAELLRPMVNHPRFTLLRRMGAGGMGVVFEAYDEERGELVALKTMRRVDPPALVRFKQEFRTLSDITHRNLVNLYQLFAVEDCWFFTMELVDGCDFLTYVCGAPLAHSERETCYSSSVSLRPRVAPAFTPAERTIEGAPGPVCFDEARLRDALAQLTEGVHALHRLGKLHRDIKPTNVMVSRSGRVVLLDFGLTADLEPSGHHPALDRQIVGTLAHMSPEQAVGLTVSAASDWYSIGVILYQALTSRLPFEGSFDEVVLQKQTCLPPRPELFVEGLPADLVALCLALLDRNPALRPGGSAILQRLRGHGETPGVLPKTKRDIPLFGRAWHRQVLDQAFASLTGQEPATVFVFGRTGTGKTTLVRSFLDDLIGAEAAVVLAGRCYEQEWFPFKAVDSLIDALAGHLKRRSRAELLKLLPGDAFLLARVFPVLRGVEGVLETRRHDTELPDPQELRLRVFAALRELLVRLSRETRLVLLIDDLQWGDVDSGVLLADLIYNPNPPVMLFLGCFRLEDADSSRILQLLRQAGQKASRPPNHRDLAVEALTLAEARELALALLGRDEAASRVQAHLVARESGGNPLFIDELTKYIQAGSLCESWDAPGRIDLETVLWSRIQNLPPSAQRLLEVVSVSGRPIYESLAFRAAELGAGSRVALGSLRSARLIRCMGPARLDQIEIYHDRIRETVLAHLPPQSLRQHHERLARILESCGQADPEVLAGHFLGAGDAARASGFFAQAADKATAALAFDHAAQLYRQALEQNRGSATEARRLCRKLGDALASSGRGAEAAEVYLQAAPGAAAAETLELKRLAATQLLISGHVDEGLVLLRTILGPLGLFMPTTPRQALFSLFRHRTILRLRGLRFRARDETQVPAEDLTRIDICWSAVAGLSVIDPILGADFQTRGLLMALRAGEPFRIARSLAMEAAHRSTAGVRYARRVQTLLDNAQSVAHELDSPQARGLILMARGITGLMLGQWKHAQTSFDQGEILLRNECTGVTWERDTVCSLALWALMHMGKIAELKRRWTILIKEAQERGDHYAATNLTTFYMATIRLAQDDPAGIEDELESVTSQWARRGFFIQHSTAFRSLVHLDLYCDRPQSAWDRVSAIWPEYSRSMLLRIQLIRIQMLELRARSALALAERSRNSQLLIQSAAADARKLAREGQEWAIAHSHYIQAGIAACRDDASTALDQLSLAAKCYDAADMHLRGSVMRYRTGEIQAGREGQKLIARAETAIERESISSPARWAQMSAPGFSRVTATQIETTV
jgi:serine/threonine protein kinase